MLDYKLIVVCLTIGYILGIVTGLFFYKQNYKTETVVSLLIFTVWLIANVASLGFDISIPKLFDIVGAGAVGNIAGLNVINLIKSFRK